MTFRVRIALAAAAAMVVAVAILGLGIRREMTARLDRQADRRVAGLVTAVRADLSREIGRARARLDAVAEAIGAEARFRLPAGGDRRWLLDWAGGAMRAGGLDALLVIDEAGRVASSGQFRAEFDRDASGLVAAAGAAPEGVLLARLRTASGALLALVALDSAEAGPRRWRLLGGVGLDSARIGALATDPEITARLALGEGDPAPTEVARVGFPLFDDERGTAGTAAVVVTRDPGPARALRRSLDRWLALTLGAGLAVAIGLGWWAAGQVSRPLEDLAAKTEALDLDRLDQEFGSDRRDEIGVLARVLGAMAGRLRASAGRLRAAERRAAIGDLARQVNHDIKNGLAPIRHVVRHLAETVERRPAAAAEVFTERRGTLESSIDYLDRLARSYAQLTPPVDQGRSDPNAVAAAVGRGSARGEPIGLELAAGLPPVRADEVALRRIVENLVTNGLDAGGRVTIATGRADGRVRIAVRDTGRGMSEEELARAFDDFYTTKPDGTGLGLSVVRRLVSDLGGSLRVETSPGAGSTFIVELPAG